MKNNRSPRFPFITPNEAVDLLRKLAEQVNQIPHNL